MGKFKDTKGREWNVDITVADVRRVLRDLNENLADAHVPDPTTNLTLIDRMRQNAVLRWDILWVLVSPQAKEKGDVTDEDFGSSLGGKAIRAASEALWTAIADFFTNQDQPGVVALMEKQAEAVALANEASLKLAAEINPAGLVEKRMAEARIQVAELKADGRASSRPLESVELETSST